MFKRLVIIFCIIFLYSNLLSLSQQLPTETDQLTIITRENFTDLERITALGEGQLYAIDWHPNNEILALGRGSGTCLLNQAFEITQCLPENEATYDVAWNESGDRLAIVTEKVLYLYEFYEASESFRATQQVTIINDSDCIVWHEIDNILFGKYRSWSDTVAPVGYYSANDGTISVTDFGDDLVNLLESNCRADTDLSSETLRIQQEYSVGRTYDFIVQGIEWDWENVITSGRLGSIHDVSWQIPNETFTYIQNNQIIHFSLLNFRVDRYSGEIIRSSILGTEPVNHLQWSPEGERLLSANSDGDTVNIWSTETTFLSGEISYQSITMYRGSTGYSANISWINNTHFSYELSDWYQGRSFSADVFNVITGERERAISIWVSYPEGIYPWFDWNLSYTAYMISTDDGFKITHILGDDNFISYDTEIGDFIIEAEIENYYFEDISCDSEGWIDDRYFMCIAQAKEIVIDIHTGDVNISQFVPTEREELFYEIEIQFNDNNNDVSRALIYDTSTGELTIKTTISDDIRVIGFESLGVIGLILETGIHFWDVATGENILNFNDPSYEVISYHPDRNLLAIGTSTGLVHLYGVPSSTE
ncbi:MAG: WD40 repeat domain-containing protein [Phototrophicaceae bacterium]